MPAALTARSHPSWPDGFLAWFLFAVAVAHVAMTALVPDLETKFQLGDRAWDRTAKLEDLFGAANLDDVLASVFFHDAPGDYILFAPAYALAGPVGVIIQNIALLLVGLYFVYRIGITYFSKPVARTGVMVYALLPGTIFHPQVFVSEAICNPLLIIATYYGARMLSADNRGMRNAVLFAGASAVLAFVRPVYLLLPLMGIAFLMASRPTRPAVLRQSAAVIAIALSLTLVWQGAKVVNDGHYPVGTSFHGLASNLYLRAERMAGIGGFALAPEIEREKAIGTAAFLGVAVDHPAALAKTIASDAVNLFANTGVNMVYGRYFGLFDLKEASDQDTFKWRDVRDREGLGAMLVMLWQTSPLGLLMNVVFVLAWGVVGLVTMVGLWRMLMARMQPAAVSVWLLAVPGYALVFTFVSGSVRWDHRTPAEFVISLLFAVGALWLAQVYRGHTAEETGHIIREGS